VRGDIRDPRALGPLVTGAEVVVHLAAYVHRRARNARQREECWSVNRDGTAALVDAIAANAPKAFLVFVSTANVYPASERALDENEPPRPRSVYGASKLAAEEIVRDAIRRGILRGAILRPAMVFGPHAPGNLALLIRLARAGWIVSVAGGGNRKSIVPIGQLVDAIVAVAEERDSTSGRTFNVAGEALSMGEIQQTIAGVVGRRVRVISVPVPLLKGAAWIAPRSREMIETYQATNVLDDSALRSLPAFSPRGDVRETLRETVRRQLEGRDAR
jgi:UDP-glucose 4-epimerase